MKEIRAAIIGTGGIAHTHAKALQSEGARIVAAADVDQTRVNEFCAQYGVAGAHTDVAAMLAGAQPDLVHICTPPGLHAALCVQCLEGGAWVLCEKPLCGSLAELDQIQAAEDKTGNYCSPVLQWRFGSGSQHLKRLIEEQAMGKPLVGISQATWYRSPAYYEVPWRGKWATELGGVTMSQGIHVLDLLLWLMGDWREVHAMIGTLDRAIEVEDVSMAVVRFENGTMGSVINSVLSPRQETYLRLDFQHATVEATGLYTLSNKDWRYSIQEQSTSSDPLDYSMVSEVSYADQLQQWQALPSEVATSHDSQIAALLDSMERNERPLTSGIEARRTLEFITCLYKSAMTGQPVERGSLTPDDPFYGRIYGTAAQQTNA